MQIAIFGSAGYIGQHILEKFQQLGLNVICYSSAVAGIFDSKTGLLAESVSIPTSVDCVIYLSQSPFYRQMPEKAEHLWGVNVISAMKVAELARQAGVSQFIYASTGNVYAPSFLSLREDCPVRRDNWYALSKLHAEEGLALYKNDMSITIARIFGVYGVNQTDKLIPNLIQSIRSSIPIKLAPKPDNDDGGGLRVSLCYIDDIVEIFSQLLVHSGQGLINLAGSEILSIRDIAQSIGLQLEIPPKFEIGNQAREFDLIADVTKLVEIFNPKFTPFSEGIQRVLA